MADVYNLTFLDNLTNPVDLFTGVNSMLNNNYMFGYLFLVVFFMIFLAFYYRYDPNSVLVVDGFVTTVVAILLFAADIVPASTIAYPFVIMAIGLIVFLFTK